MNKLVLFLDIGILKYVFNNSTCLFDIFTAHLSGWNFHFCSQMV